MGWDQPGKRAQMIDLRFWQTNLTFGVVEPPLSGRIHPICEEYEAEVASIT